MLIDALLRVLLWLLRAPRALYRSRRTRSLAGLLCIGLSLVAVDVLAAYDLPQRIDLTQGRLYALSPETTETLARIDEPVVLRFYYSPQLGAAIAADARYAMRVRTLLEQYAAAAPGKLRLDTADAWPLSAAAASAVVAGLRPVPLGGRGDAGFFGLVGTNSTDDRAIVARFDPRGERRLEYDLTRLVYTLALPNAAPAAADADLAALRRRSEAEPPPLPIERLRRVGGAGANFQRWQVAIELADIGLAPVLVGVAALAMRRRRPAIAG